MTQLIENWRQAWKFYSVWAFAVIAALPDLYNALAAFGAFEDMPDAASWTVRGAAILGIVVRFVSQQKPEGAPPKVEPCD